MRLGIVGAGEVAWRHAAAAAELDDLTLTAVSDRDPERAAALASHHGAQPKPGLDEVIEAADLIVLAVPHALHEDLARRVAAAGRQVLVEKPLSTTLDSADRLIAATGSRLHVGQQGRFFAQVAAARQELPRIGRPLLYLERRSTDYQRPGRPAWFADRTLAGGGIAMLVGIHSIDRFCWLLDTEVRAVAGAIAMPHGWEIETAVAATLHPAGGPAASLTLVDDVAFVHETTIIGERGTMRIEPDGLTVNGRRVLTVDPDAEYTASFRRQYQAILRGEPTAAPREGRHAIAVVEALYRSAAGTGTAVPVSP